MSGRETAWTFLPLEFLRGLNTSCSYFFSSRSLRVWLNDLSFYSLLFSHYFAAFVVKDQMAIENI